MILTKKILIKGKVQEVFFRKFIRNNALKFNIKGYVKNLLNRDVEAILQGEEENLNKIINICKIGPNSANITKIIIKKIKSSYYKDFEIK